MSSVSSKSTVVDDISNIRNEFYSSRRKSIFFKSSQKNECAEYVTSKISVQDLIQHTITILPSTFIIYIDYTLFKQFASPTNYDEIIKHLFDCIHTLITEYGKFELHIHLATFSVSAAERYKDFIQHFYQIYFQGNVDYCGKMNAMHIYYVPSMMNTISTIMRTYMTEYMKNRALIRDKIFMYNKEESAIRLTTLFGTDDQERST